MRNKALASILQQIQHLTAITHGVVTVVFASYISAASTNMQGACKAIELHHICVRHRQTQRRCTPLPMLDAYSNMKSNTV